MIRRVIKFLDNHRIILVFLILLLISIIFLSIKSFCFFHHSFKSLSCTEQIDDIYCYHNEKEIFKNGEKMRQQFFWENENKIVELKENYKLPEWNQYTSYYYEIAALLDSSNNDELYDFFHIYNNTYEISEFYQKNIFYYDIFYHYKINLNSE